LRLNPHDMTDENVSTFNLVNIMYLFYFLLQTVETQCAVYWDAIAGHSTDCQ